MVFFEAGHKVATEFEALYDRLATPRRGERRKAAPEPVRA
jgi:hypothetical protein